MIGSFVGVSVSAEPINIDSLINSIVTGGSAPEEVLKEINSYGMKWHLTETGDLWLKSWRLGAENFVPAENVMKIREGGEVHSEANALEWVSKNLSYLRQEYPGKWIAVVDDEVVCASDSLTDLMQQLHDNNIEQPFITEIPAQPVVWTTTYANERI